jgi:hypothetical protein
MALTLIGVAATLVAAFIGAWAALRAGRLPRPALELVDVTVPKPADASEPVIDVKVSNRGGRTAVIKRVQVEVVESLAGWVPVRVHAMTSGSLDVSKRYRSELPVLAYERGHVFKIPVSQKVAGGDADRFQVSLLMPSFVRDGVYLLRLTLLYDDKNRKVAVPLVAVTGRASFDVRAWRALSDQAMLNGTTIGNDARPAGTAPHPSPLDDHVYMKGHTMRQSDVQPRELLALIEQAEAVSPALEAVTPALRDLAGG